MPFAPKCQMPVNGQLIMISLEFHWVFIGVFRYYSGLRFGRSLFVPKKRLIEQIHGCP